MKLLPPPLGAGAGRVGETINVETEVFEAPSVKVREIVYVPALP